MRFLDANVFIYAYYKPKRKLGETEKGLKDRAKEIIQRVSQGEEPLTTVVHLSEVANILKKGLEPKSLNALTIGLLTIDNLEILGVTPEDYLSASELGQELNLDPNDALATETMKEHGVREIYSFDTDFDRIEGIERVTT